MRSVVETDFGQVPKPGNGGECCSRRTHVASSEHAYNSYASMLIGMKFWETGNAFERRSWRRSLCSLGFRRLKHLHLWALFLKDSKSLLGSQSRYNPIEERNDDSAGAGVLCRQQLGDVINDVVMMLLAEVMSSAPAGDLGIWISKDFFPAIPETCLCTSTTCHHPSAYVSNTSQVMPQKTLSYIACEDTFKCRSSVSEDQAAICQDEYTNHYFRSCPPNTPAYLVSSWHQ